MPSLPFENLPGFQLQDKHNASSKVRTEFPPNSSTNITKLSESLLHIVIILQYNFSATTISDTLPYTTFHPINRL